MTTNHPNFSFPPIPAFTPPPLPAPFFQNQDLSWRTQAVATSFFSSSLEYQRAPSSTDYNPLLTARPSLRQNPILEFHFSNRAFGSTNTLPRPMTANYNSPSANWVAPFIKDSPQFLPKLTLGTRFDRTFIPRYSLYTQEDRTFFAQKMPSPQFGEQNHPHFFPPQFAPRQAPNQTLPTYRPRQPHTPNFPHTVVVTVIEPPPPKSTVQISVIGEEDQATNTPTVSTTGAELSPNTQPLNHSLIESDPISPASVVQIALTGQIVDIWHGVKNALARIGLEQMDMNVQEQAEILDKMAFSQKCSRTSIKERMTAAAIISRPLFNSIPSEWVEIQPGETANFVAPPSSAKQTLTRSKDRFYDFERMVQIDSLFPNLSRSFDLGRPELAKGGIGWINGIKNLFSDSTQSAELLSSYAGGANVHSVYNAHTGFIKDNVRVLLGMHDSSMTRAVLEIHETWSTFFAKAGPNERFLQFCHSGGATQCDLALKSYPPELRKRIVIIAIAPATYISRQLCHRVVHYVSKRDLVPMVDRSGKAQFGDTVVVLDPHPDVPRLAKFTYQDHGINSPTYQAVIKQEIQKFIKESEKW